MFSDLKKSLEYMKSPDVAAWKKIVATGAAAMYFAFPADVLPDVVPVLGHMDDVAVVTLISKGFNRLAGMDLEKARERNVFDAMENICTTYDREMGK